MIERKIKQCPFCHEEILATAIKCKHCASDLRESKEKVGEIYGNLMLAIPIIFLIIGLNVIGDMKLSQNLYLNAALVARLTTITTAIIAAIEAYRLGMGNEKDLDKRGIKRSGPISWLAVISLLWIFGYPAYLYHRSKYGLKNRLASGIAITLIYSLLIAFHLYILKK